MSQSVLYLCTVERLNNVSRGNAYDQIRRCSACTGESDEKMEMVESVGVVSGIGI